MSNVIDARAFFEHKRVAVELARVQEIEITQASIFEALDIKVVMWPELTEESWDANGAPVDE
jgi:hypothetical protein